MACSQTILDDLLKQRARLLRIMTSGVLEIEQPALGRTQYRTLDEVQSALNFLDSKIAECAGANGDPAALAMKRRRPIYPVVREV